MNRYLGDWHTHPAWSVALSKIDRLALRGIAGDAADDHGGFRRWGPMETEHSAAHQPTLGTSAT